MFISNFENRDQIDHINNIRNDNHFLNLRWATNIENSNNKKKVENNKRTNKKVIQINNEGEIITEFNSISEASKILKIKDHRISEVCRGIRSEYKGCKFKFTEVEILENEIWKDCHINPKYKISNYGRVKTSNNIITYGHFDNSKYCVIEINKKHCRVHRLVCDLFKPNINHENLEVNHIDKNRSNNHIDNLEWCTGSQNVQHAYDKSSNPKDNSYRHRKVNQYTLDGKFIKTFECIKDATLSLGKNKSAIWKACRGEYKTSLGFIWKYADDNQIM